VVAAAGWNVWLLVVAGGDSTGLDDGYIGGGYHTELADPGATGINDG